MSGSVQQAGPITPGHAASWGSNGVILDAGAPNAGVIKEFGVTNNGSVAIGVIDNAGTPNTYFQISVNNTGTATLAVSAYGTLTPVLQFNVGGTIVPIGGNLIAASSLAGNSGASPAIASSVAVGSDRKSVV